jgi:hypothetical protein
MVDEITLGPLTFQLERTGDGQRVTGMAIVNGEETVGWIESITAETWEEFHAAAAMGATVVQAMTPVPMRGHGGAWESPEAREATAYARHEQTMQMLGALQFQFTVLTMSLGAVLGRPEAHDVIRKDVADLEAQAQETGKFIRRLLYVRAQENR